MQWQVTEEAAVTPASFPLAPFLALRQGTYDLGGEPLDTYWWLESDGVPIVFMDEHGTEVLGPASVALCNAFARANGFGLCATGYQRRAAA